MRRTGGVKAERVLAEVRPGPVFGLGKGQGLARDSVRGLGFWLSALAVAGLMGCRVESSGSGNDQKVRVVTPFGGVQVKTSEQAVQSAIGLPVYPGATLARKEEGEGKGKEDGVADIELNFGDMRLRVKALSYQTGDSPDQVQAFYRKQMQRFGVVIVCRNDRPVGEPARTPEGLTCDKEKEGSAGAAANVSAGETQLKAGSPQHQHLVSIEADGSGTRFGLVALDLPRALTQAAGTDDH